MMHMRSSGLHPTDGAALFLLLLLLLSLLRAGGVSACQFYMDTMGPTLFFGNLTEAVTVARSYNGTFPVRTCNLATVYSNETTQTIDFPFTLMNDPASTDPGFFVSLVVDSNATVLFLVSDYIRLMNLRIVTSGSLVQTTGDGFVSMINVETYSSNIVLRLNGTSLSSAIIDHGYFMSNSIGILFETGGTVHCEVCAFMAPRIGAVISRYNSFSNMNFTNMVVMDTEYAFGVQEKPGGTIVEAQVTPVTVDEKHIYFGMTWTFNSKNLPDQVFGSGNPSTTGGGPCDGRVDNLQKELLNTQLVVYILVAFIVLAMFAWVLFGSTAIM